MSIWRGKPKIGAFGYFAQAQTIVPTAGIFVPLSGERVSPFIEKFHYSEDGLVFDGPMSMELAVQWSMSASADSNTRQVHGGIAKNGEALTETSIGVSGTFLKIANEPQIICGSDVKLVNPGDYLLANLTSNVDNTTITVYHFTYILTPMFQQ